MKFSLSAALAIALGALIGACGQKGALVLPDQAKHRKIPQVPRPQPSASPAAPKGDAAGSAPSTAPGGPPNATPPHDTPSSPTR